MCDLTDSYVRRDLHTFDMNHCSNDTRDMSNVYIKMTIVKSLTHMCDMTDSYERQDFNTSYMSWSSKHMRDVSNSYITMTNSMTFIMKYLHVWHDSFVYVAWLIDTCDMTHSYVWYDFCVSIPQIIHMCDMKKEKRVMSHIRMSHVARIKESCYTLLYLRHESFMCAIWCIRRCDDMAHWYVCDMIYSNVQRHGDMTHSYAWGDAFIYVTWLIHISRSTVWGGYD